MCPRGDGIIIAGAQMQKGFAENCISKVTHTVLPQLDLEGNQGLTLVHHHYSRIGGLLMTYSLFKSITVPSICKRITELSPVIKGADAVGLEAELNIEVLVHILTFGKRCR